MPLQSLKGAATCAAPSTRSIRLNYPMTEGSPEPLAARPSRSSRFKYDEYQRRLDERAREKKNPDAEPAEPEKPAGERLPGDRFARERKKPRTRSFNTLFAQFWVLLRGQRARLIWSLVLLGLSTLFGLIPLYAPKIIIDSVLGTHPLPHWMRAGWPNLPNDPHALLAWVSLAMIALAVVSMLVSTSSRWVATKVSKRVVVNARRQAFEHAVRLPLHRVYELKSGGVASILRDDAGGVGELVFSMLYNPARAIVQLAGSLLILATVDWRLLLGSLVMLPVVWLTHRTWINRIRPLFRDIRTTRQGIDAHATESFGGMRVVRSFGRQRTETTTFTTDNHLMARQEIFAWWWMRGIDAAWAVIIPLASAILLWYGGSRILSDSAAVAAGKLLPGQAFTTGDLFIFLGYLAALLGPIAALAQSATGFQNNLAGLDRTLDLLEEPGEMPSTENSLRLEKADVAGRVKISDLGFAYMKGPKKRRKGKSGGSSGVPEKSPDAPAEFVLRHVDLDVAPGEMVAFVGPSGAGKTTLCNLIARFYDPTEGSIKLDGTDLRDIDVDSYRRLLGIVEQDTFLFDGSIAENIAYGRRDATMDQIVDAAKKANAHGFITGQDGGYETMIGERGVKLSGGQQQRLTIARAILADPKILILDEATSNLDTESERLIQGSLKTLMRGRTSFVIAHRLSTIAGADRIVVIDHGRIIEQGTHGELMSRSGRYRQMVDLQTRPAEEDPAEEDEEAVAAPHLHDHHANGHPQHA